MPAKKSRKARKVKSAKVKNARAKVEKKATLGILTKVKKPKQSGAKKEYTIVGYKSDGTPIKKFLKGLWYG